MAFLVPHAPRQPVFHAPAVVLLLIAALVAAHVARTMVPPEQSLAWINRFAFIPARYSPALRSQYETLSDLFQGGLPFLSYIAIHNDYTHLGINCLWLFAFGPIVARRFGAVLFLLFFLVCGVAGAAAHLAFNWGSIEPVIGASGAISGLMGAGVRLLPTERPAWAAQGPAADAPMLALWSRQIVMFSLVWGAINLMMGVTGLGMRGEVGVIAWQAHLGGYIAGLLLSGLFDRIRPEPVGEPLG